MGEEDFDDLLGLEEEGAGGVHLAGECLAALGDLV